VILVQLVSKAILESQDPRVLLVGRVTVVMLVCQENQEREDKEVYQEPLEILAHRVNVVHLVEEECLDKMDPLAHLVCLVKRVQLVSLERKVQMETKVALEHQDYQD